MLIGFINTSNDAHKVSSKMYQYSNTGNINGYANRIQPSSPTSFQLRRVRRIPNSSKSSYGGL